ncbi:acetyl-CoA acetyltransferase [Pseudonocardia autotrophica]|uniref:Lipid-transfer protein n=1 Tax=Pseudonocardia autotrophica TaxID=2074 RepID=A0A1Y2MPA8_PSEAH|nr:lipid-transfer protein [Pseudonocardia autotrophica]TDN72047.1 acetyl-CoA acetyltransferase [Pseudonocardia autotrophica]
MRCSHDTVYAHDLAHAIGVPQLTFWSDVGPGGVAPAAMVGQAVAAILSGQAETVVVFRELNGRSGRRYGLADAAGDRVGGAGTYDEFFLPYGLLTPGQVFAMLARRHMAEFGTEPEHLGHIALTCRERANANPAAQMHERTMTMDDYLGSRPIAEPLRLFDFCLETDGACAVVVTSTERARDLRRPPALIRAVAQASIPDPQPGMMYPILMRDSLTELPAAAVARTLWSRAGLGPGDVDVAQLYDCFTITVLLQLEDWGFCAKGEGGPFAASGNLGPGGSLPINTAGGHLSEGYVHGMNHVLEGVRQIRGTSTSQVPGAETCLVATTPLPPGSGLLLRSDG